MPAVRFSRDKRGYEYVYLVHTPVRRGRPGRSRVLYWYRTPPGVRIGRKPFDEEVRRTLEQQNPGVTFDWEAIIATPIPPPDMTEFWRERRRAEKAARVERRAEEAAAEQEVEGQAPEAGDDQESAGEDGESTQQSEGSRSGGPNARPARKRKRRRGGPESAPDPTAAGEPSAAAAATSEEAADRPDDDL